MTISDRILGKKNVNGQPRIEAVAPAAALPGGEIRIIGCGLRPPDLRRPRVRFGEMDAPIVISADDFVVARVPQGAASGGVVVSTNGHSSNAHPLHVAALISENLHPVTNPALDAEGNIYATFSGSRGQKVPVSIFKIARDRQIFVFATIEPSVSAYHLAFGPHGDLFVTGPTPSSFDSVYKIDAHGAVSVFYRGLGRPQGMAFDREGNLHVAASLGGKRGIVRITPDGKASLAVAGPGLVGLAFAPGRAAILASTSAVYHLAWDTAGQPLLDLT